MNHENGDPFAIVSQLLGRILSVEEEVDVPVAHPVGDSVVREGVAPPGLGRIQVTGRKYPEP